MRKYIALIGHGPQWLEGKSVYEQGKPVEEHLVAMRRHFDDGVLELGWSVRPRRRDRGAQRS